MPYAEPTPEEVRAFAQTLDVCRLAREMLCLKRHLDTVGEKAGANSRDAALASLLGMIEFVQNQLRYPTPPPALTGLHIALAALDDGVVLPLLKKRKTTGQPASDQTRLLHGCAAAVMDCLMQSGFSRQHAGTIVSNHLQTLGIEFGDRRGAVAWKSIANWRSRAAGGVSDLGKGQDFDVGTEAYKRLCAMFKRSGNRDADRKDLIELLTQSLRNLMIIA